MKRKYNSFFLLNALIEKIEILLLLFKSFRCSRAIYVPSFYILSANVSDPFDLYTNSDSGFCIVRSLFESYINKEEVLFVFLSKFFGQ
jgi:hypothetical protein